MIFTYSNADFLGTDIIKLITHFCDNNHNSKIFNNLGQLNSFSCIKYCNGMVGNSSSGIIQMPSLKVWTLDIGDRQKGRIKAKSVFNVKIDKNKISCKLIFLLKKKKIIKVFRL